MEKHNVSGIDSTYGGSMFKDPGNHPGMDVLDARDGTDTWMDRYIQQVETTGEAVVALSEKAA